MHVIFLSPKSKYMLLVFSLLVCVEAQVASVETSSGCGIIIVSAYFAITVYPIHIFVKTRSQTVVFNNNAPNQCHDPKYRQQSAGHCKQHTGHSLAAV